MMNELKMRSSEIAPLVGAESAFLKNVELNIPAIITAIIKK